MRDGDHDPLYVRDCRLLATQTNKIGFARLHNQTLAHNVGAADVRANAHIARAPSHVALLGRFHTPDCTVANSNVGAMHDRSVTLVSTALLLIARAPFFGPQCAWVTRLGKDAFWVTRFGKDAFWASLRRERSVEVTGNVDQWEQHQ